MEKPQLTSTYTASLWEDKLYTLWEKSGFFNPDNLPGERTEAFSIIMPPPNANGRLHVGHALFITIEDLLIRFHRMNGKRALWVPGADHAGFETQIVYEKKLESEGRSRFDMSREELYQNILDFTLENKQYMESDVRKMGASCDWSREKFTLDSDIVLEVQETFRKMFNDGLVYRGSRIVNWCSKHQTSLSDVETEFIEKKDPFYYLQYGPFVIGTARPETKFGDKYVVIHPNDERYKEYSHGQEIHLEWINGPVTATIIKDEAIDMEFGTGVMTITPWHDATDFEIAERHNLDREQIIGLDGTLLPIAEEFAGLPIQEAREKIVEKLNTKGLLVKTDAEYVHSVKSCYKCATTIEPQIMNQWFVKMKPLAELALKAVRDDKKIKFYPESYQKVFTYWMENTIDWNISRQIVWGITIPAQYCSTCNKGFIDKKDKETCECGGKIVIETDTFDTWFSSGQWPLLALGYPNSKDVETYHPTSVMETGHDLIFKWIPRMVIFSLYLKKEIPFKNVYLHGLVNDEHGKKMSKSKGNVISPIDLSEKYGTDAMRIALIIGNAAGNNLSLSYEKVEAARNFANKLWNMGRYITTAVPSEALRWDTDDDFNSAKLSEADKWILSHLANTKEDVTKYLENYNISLAAEKLRDFTWNDVADWYIEVHKVEKNDVVLVTVFNELIKMWHPFMPFVTEALYQSLYGTEELPLMVRNWETTNINFSDPTSSFQSIIDLITRIRNVRALYHIDPKEKPWLTIVDPEKSFETFIPLIERLGRIEEVALTESSKQPSETASLTVGDIKAFLHLGGVIDIEKERSRLSKEKLETENHKAGIEKRLSDPRFVEKAPKNIIEQNQTSLQEAEKKLIELAESLNNLAK